MGRAVLASVAGLVLVGAAAWAGAVWVLRPRAAAPPRPAPARPAPPGLAPALAALLARVDADWPHRGRASDGGAPSAAHHGANPNSDHERGDAYDFTRDLVGGPNLESLAVALLRDPRITYVIFDRRIANRSIADGAWRPYLTTAVQTDPHTSHLHVSIDHAQRDSTVPWDLSAVASGEAVS